MALVPDWVHRDNVMEVKTYVLRRLPVLIYNSQASNVADGTQDDPTITSLYFDSPKFSLYTANVNRTPKAASLRLRWYGRLQDNPEIFLERKTMVKGDESEETRISIKEKYVQPFIEGKYKMEKTVGKLQAQQGQTVLDTERYRQTVEEIQQFIMENNLQPMLRATYTRTAFQIPGNGRIRVSLDTNLVFAQEDQSHRENGSWHRTELDPARSDGSVVGGDGDIRQPQKSEFPFALLEIRVREGNRRRMPEWVSDLVSSHLVHETPRFSKFVHGVAVLFEQQVNSLPFWISDLGRDIRKDPAKAFEEENDKAAIQAQDELAVGSLLSVERGGHLHRRGRASGHADARRLGRTHDLSVRLRRESKETLLAQARHDVSADAVDGERREWGDVMIDGGNGDGRGVGGQEEEEVSRSGSDGSRRPTTTTGSDDGRMWRNMGALLLPRFTLAQDRRQYGTMIQPTGDEDGLPIGVRHPGLLLKDSGPVKVEPKVWMANERTFVRWQHCSILLGSLALALFNAVPSGDSVGRSLAMVYMALACFAGLWGWAMYLRRSHLIRRRSGRDFDNVLGPMVVCLGLVFALSLNFFLQVSLR